ncbi:MAG: hypothetical protein Q3988_04060 [Gemella sp.]|nr:hypothetical protein [Gemella sp.]
MEKSRVKLAFILVGICFVLAFVMWYGFGYLWEKYPDQGIFKTLRSFAPLIASLLVFIPELIIRNKKAKENRE